jgi:hypothetical protein
MRGVSVVRTYSRPVAHFPVGFESLLSETRSNAIANQFPVKFRNAGKDSDRPHLARLQFVVDALNEADTTASNE